MKNILFAYILGLLVHTPAQAQMPYLEEVKALGIISGQGMACASPQHPTVEMLARAILLTKAPSQNLLTEAAYIYNEAKANTYISKQLDGYDQCDIINRRFENQDIFKITLYADGTLKMPDGNSITPQQPYDANALYKPDRNFEQKIRSIFEKAPSRLPNNIQEPTINSIKPENKSSTKAIPSGYNNQQTYSGETYAPSSVGHIRRNRP